MTIRPRATMMRLARGLSRRRYRPEQHIVLGDYHRARRGFRSDAEMARVIGVVPERVAAWRRGELTDVDAARLLAAFGIVVGELAEFMDPEVISDWLTTPQVEAGNQEPAELLRRGALAEVLQLVNATEHGAYV